MTQRIDNRSHTRALLLAVALAAAGAAIAQEAVAPDPENVALGQKLYVDAGCHNCHGLKGQGGVSVDFPRGPSLRASALDHQSMADIITCGIPGTRMPAWLKGAYAETPCFNLPVGPAPAGTIVTGVFTPTEISALVDYIQTELVQR